MDCRTAHFLIEAFYDDELDATSAATLLAHLEKCPPCADRRDEVEGLHRVVSSCRPKDRCPEELSRRVASALVSCERKPAGLGLRRVAVRGAWLAAGVLVGAVGFSRAGGPWPAAAPGSGPPSAREVSGRVFCLSCALKSAFPEGPAPGEHRLALRTADGRVFVIRTDAAQRDLLAQAGCCTRPVPAVARLDGSDRPAAFVRLARP